jgi:RNA polymerase sigma-70 factor, ECF subfamily
MAYRVGGPREGLLNESSSNSADQIVQLLTNIQQQLTRYVRTLVPNRTDAEEVLQETNLFIWRHADEFEPGTNFAAWASKIAFFQVLTFRKRQSRSRLYFSDELVEQLAQSTVGRGCGETTDAEALDLCMDKLSRQDRELMELRYEPGATVESISRQVGRSTKAIYAALGRIRTWLLDCMQRTVSESGRR